MKLTIVVIFLLSIGNMGFSQNARNSNRRKGEFYFTGAGTEVYTVHLILILKEPIMILL